MSRGQLLYSVADYIVHMSRKAWGHRVAVRNASTADERWELIKRSKISMMRELEISLLRMFCSGVGALLVEPSRCVTGPAVIRISFCSRALPEQRAAQIAFVLR